MPLISEFYRPQVHTKRVSAAARVQPSRAAPLGNERVECHACTAQLTALMDMSCGLLAGADRRADCAHDAQPPQSQSEYLWEHAGLRGVLGSAAS
jgi:hypothetical protein